MHIKYGKRYIHNHFHAKTKAKSRYLRTELRNTRKGECSIGEFLTRIKTIVDSLLAIGQPVSVQEQIDVILEGLPSEYGGGKGRVNMIEEIQSLPLAQEQRLEK